MRVEDSGAAAPFASTRCGRTAAPPVAITPRARARRLRRRSRSASTRRHASASAARSCGRTTSPTTACPPLLLPTARSPTAASSPRSPSTRRTITAVLTTTTTRSSQDNVMLRAEHDFSPAVTLRNQTRYNRAEREAVITSIANPAAYNPDTNLVTLSRQVNFRTNEIFSNQTNLTARLTTGKLHHDLSAGHGDLEREPVCADDGWRRHARADRLEPARCLQSCPGHERRADRRALRWRDRHGGALRLRRLRHRPALPHQRRRPRRELQHEVTRDRCDRHRDRRRRRRHARQRQGGPDFPAQRQRQSVCLLRLVADAAGISQLPAQRRRHESEQSERRPAEIGELRGRLEVGSRRATGCS